MNHMTSESGLQTFFLDDFMHGRLYRCMLVPEGTSAHRLGRPPTGPRIAWFEGIV